MTCSQSLAWVNMSGQEAPERIRRVQHTLTGAAFSDYPAASCPALDSRLCTDIKHAQHTQMRLLRSSTCGEVTLQDRQLVKLLPSNVTFTGQCRCSHDYKVLECDAHRQKVGKRLAGRVLLNCWTAIRQTDRQSGFSHDCHMYD